MAVRRSTNQRGNRQTTQQKEREQSALVHLGGLWDKESKKSGQYYLGSVSTSINPKTGKSGLDGLRELLDSLGEGESISVFAFYNEDSERNEHAPTYKLYASVYDPKAVGGNGRRGGRR